MSENVREIKADGSFNRQKNRFTTPFGHNEGELPIEEEISAIMVSGLPLGTQVRHCSKFAWFGRGHQFRDCEPNEAEIAACGLGIFFG